MTLNTSHAFPTLGLILNGAERSRLVRSVADVAEVLVRDWPCDDGEEYINALVACLEAHKNNIPPSAAREALIRAADEVSMPYLSLVS